MSKPFDFTSPVNIAIPTVNTRFNCGAEVVNTSATGDAETYGPPPPPETKDLYSLGNTFSYDYNGETVTLKIGDLMADISDEDKYNHYIAVINANGPSIALARYYYFLQYVNENNLSLTDEERDRLEYLSSLYELGLERAVNSQNAVIYKKLEHQRDFIEEDILFYEKAEVILGLIHGPLKITEDDLERRSKSLFFIGDRMTMEDVMDTLDLFGIEYKYNGMEIEIPYYEREKITNAKTMCRENIVYLEGQVDNIEENMYYIKPVSSDSQRYQDIALTKEYEFYSNNYKYSDQFDSAISHWSNENLMGAIMHNFDVSGIETVLFVKDGEREIYLDKFAIIERLKAEDPTRFKKLTEGAYGHELNDAYNLCYKYMTPAEINMYHFLFKNNGYHSAEAFLYSMTNELNRRRGQAEAEAKIKEIKNGNQNKAELLADLFGEGVCDGVSYFFEGIRHSYLNDSTISANDYYRMYLMQYLEQEGMLGEYNFGFTIGNMIPPILISTAVSVAIDPATGQFVGNVAMGVSTYGNTRYTALIEGKSYSEAETYAMMITSSEMIIGYLLGKIPGLSKVSASSFKHLLTEGFEEAVQTGVVEPAARAVIFGEDIDLEELAFDTLDSFFMGVMVAGTMSNISQITINGTQYVFNVQETLQYIYDNPGISAAEAFSKVNNIPIDGISYNVMPNTGTNYSFLINGNQKKFIECVSVGKNSDGSLLYAYRIDGNVYYSNFDLRASYKNGDYSRQHFIKDEFLSPERLKEVSDNNNGYLGEFTYDKDTGTYVINNPKFSRSWINKYDIFFTENKIGKADYGVNQNSNEGLTDYEKKRTKSILVQEYGFSAKNAEIIISQMDSTGVCSYADKANTIFAHYIDKPGAFKQDFGFDMYITLPDGKKVLNKGQLIADMYVYCNSIRNGGNLFDHDINTGKYTIASTDQNGNLNTKNQRTVDDQWGLDLFNSFLKSHNSSLSYNSNYIIDTCSGETFDKSGIGKLSSDIQNNLINGNTLSLYVNVSKDDPLETVAVDTGLVHEIQGPHIIFITDVDDKGIYVCNWGRKMYITYESLQGINFYITSSEITGIS